MTLYIILCTTKDRQVQSNKAVHADNGKQAMEDLLTGLKSQYPTEHFVVDSYECWKENAEQSKDEGKEQTHLETHYKMRLDGLSDEKSYRDYSYKFLRNWKKPNESLPGL